MYRSANSGTVIQSKEEMAWARSVRSAGEKHVQNVPFGKQRYSDTVKGGDGLGT